MKYGIDYQDTKWEGENARTSFMQGWGYDSYNPFGYGGAGGLADDSCSLTRNVATSPSNPHWSGLTTRGRGCVYVDYNSPRLSCQGEVGAGLTPVEITNVNGQIQRSDFSDITSCIGRGTGDAEVADTAFYLRDRFTLGDHWTFNIGVRGEMQEAWNDIRRKVVDATYVDPRISISYDVKGDGRLLFTANWGQHHAMLNQAWISGGGDTAGGMHDQWNGYEGYEVWLFCDPIEAFVFCRVPDREDTRRAGTVGLPASGLQLRLEHPGAGPDVGRRPPLPGRRDGRRGTARSGATTSNRTTGTIWFSGSNGSSLRTGRSTSSTSTGRCRT